MLLKNVYCIFKFFIEMTKETKESLLNSYFCLKWAFWAARPVMKKKLVVNYEQLLRAVFSCFHGQTFFFFFKFHTLGSALKSFFFELKTVFLGLAVLVIE